MSVPPDPDKLTQMQTFGHRAYTEVLLRHLATPTDATAAVFRSPVLRRRTRETIAYLLRTADQKDRASSPHGVREQWRAVRAAARAERAAIEAIEVEEARAAWSPRRRALERLAGEHLDELAALRAVARRGAHRSLLQDIARRYPTRMIELLREERTR